MYNLAKSFRKDVVQIANTFPKDEKFLLTAQMKDSARSGRFHYQEAIQFCRIARGSLLETFDHLSSALDEAYITEARFCELKLLQEQLLKKINGYIAYLKRRKQEG